MYTSIIEEILITLFKYFLQILDHPQSRQSAKHFLQSSVGTPSHSFAGDGVRSPNSDEGTDTEALYRYICTLWNSQS
jgi:hypothetical protein